MSFMKNIKNGSNWNIGFSDITKDDFISSKELGRVTWMKHTYRDRFFADPFILKVTPENIVVLAEEYIFDNPPGRIVELVVDRKTKCLKKRYELLKLPTHLSYPAIIRINNEIYVYPENGQSGQLNLYRYDAENHKLVDPLCILNKPVADATIFHTGGYGYILTATMYPETQECAYIFKSKAIFDSFEKEGAEIFQKSRSCSRPAGDLFEVNGIVYRPAQDCSLRYGGALSIMCFDPKSQRETLCFNITPDSFKYPLGIHTINFKDGVVVVDGYGYLNPIIGRIYASKPLKTIRNLIKKGLRK